MKTAVFPGFGRSKRSTSKTTRRCYYKSRLVKNVVDYLTSDSYLFSPLLASASSSHWPASKPGSSSGTGVQCKGKRRSKRLVRVVADYLTSDSHMYAPLVAPHPVASPRGHTHYTKKTTTEVWRTKFSTKDNQTIIESSNLTTEDQISEEDLPEGSVFRNKQKSVQRKMVKRKVYQKCCPSSLTGAVDSKLRPLSVE